MGDRHNRKRTRHRPLRRQRLCQQLDNSSNIATLPPTTVSIPDQPAPPCACWRPSNRQQTISTTTLSPKCLSGTRPTCSSIPDGSSSDSAACRGGKTSTASARTPETPSSRARRVFGGLDVVDLEEESTELCGPMLDVVLGLFGAVDYDDDADYDDE